MIFQNLHGLNSLLTKVIPLMSLLSGVDWFEMKRTYLPLPLQPTMEENFSPNLLKNGVTSMESSIIFRHQELHNKMVWWKGKIELRKRCVEQC